MPVLSPPELTPVALNHINPHGVPSKVGEYLSRRARAYPNPGPQPGDFDELFAALHPNDVTSYAAIQSKPTEHAIHVVDALPSGEVVGYGKVRYELTDHPHFADKPYISMLSTKESYRSTRQGNLLGRLAVMRDLTELMFGLPLYSDRITFPAALSVGQRFVRAGLAEAVQEGDRVRFRSILTKTK